MSIAVIGLGTNLGEREENLKQAVRAIDRLPGTLVIGNSGVYDTVPFGVTGEQDNFLNCCVCVETSLSPQALLGACLGIEASMGRKRVKNQVIARVIDLDLLIYDGQTSETQELMLPHPRISERAFVLVPLAELFPEKKICGYDFAEAFDTVDKSEVNKYGNLKC